MPSCVTRKTEIHLYVNLPFCILRVHETATLFVRKNAILCYRRNCHPESYVKLPYSVIRKNATVCNT